MHHRIERGWEVAAAPPGGDMPERWLPASVPGTAASALRAAKQWGWDDRRAFDAEDWWWRVPLAGASGRLNFDGVATLWDAWVDGVRVAGGDSMFERTSAVIEGGQQLVIRCRSLDEELKKKRPRPRWKVPMLENQQLRWFRTSLLGRTPGWSPPCPAVGPWRPVWFGEPVKRPSVRLEGADGVIEGDGELVVRRAGREWRGEGSVRIANVERWWPHTHGEPALYEVNGAHVGFRDVSFDGYEVRVNGVVVFCRGACWTPIDVVSLQATREQYDAAVAQMRDAGMNMLRIGGTMVYEDDALYDALDAHGVLLWQDVMCANMDYPEELAGTIRDEVRQEIARLRGRPSLAVVCGNSEGSQQAAMSGAPTERWYPAMFARLVEDAPYVPSSTFGGAFPHAPNAGVASYYGVGAYLRPLDDARRSEVRFASECLAFANISADPAQPKVHSVAWKQRAPRDLGAGWDFDDVRDHYVKVLFGVDPVALRTVDHERYLALGRVASGEVMAQTFGEWRRARSVCRGGLVWFLRDLWPGAGWGVVDATGAPKPAWYALRRALQAVAVAITDEGCNGLAVNVVNDRADELATTLELSLYRASAKVGGATSEVRVPARGAIEIPAAGMLEGFYDLSWAYRFGPPVADVVHVRAGDVEAFWWPQPIAREADVGLAATAGDGEISITARKFAQYVTIECRGYVPADSGFHLAPGQTRTIAMRGAGPLRGIVGALNAEATARFGA